MTGWAGGATIAGATAITAGAATKGASTGSCFLWQQK